MHTTDAAGSGEDQQRIHAVSVWAESHWSDQEVGALLALIVTINAWNGLAAASRAWEPTLSEQAGAVPGPGHRRPRRRGRA